MIRHPEARAKRASKDAAEAQSKFGVLPILEMV
jgi:hypothetical protein